MRKTELWFSKPGSRWMEALPVGNGRIGGMIYGGASTERIDLTESTVWSGAPSDKNVNPTALENLGRIRELMFAGSPYLAIYRIREDAMEIVDFFTVPKNGRNRGLEIAQWLWW